MDRGQTRVRWGVPSTEYWWIAGGTYLGTLIIRHCLTPGLALSGGHIGYHVVAPHQRQGHATRMLAAALPLCRALGLPRVLLTCHSANTPSHRVIRANGGRHTATHADEHHYWLEVPG
ncbi:GNAT family N-acetyltransferase [Actinocorallia lasiicapitis]